MANDNIIYILEHFYTYYSDKGTTKGITYSLYNSKGVSLDTFTSNKSIGVLCLECDYEIMTGVIAHRLGVRLFN